MVLVAERFTVLGPQHQVVLAVFVAGLVMAVWAGRRALRHDRHTVTLLCRALAVALVTGLGTLQVCEWVVDGFTLTGNLPLQICDLVWMVLAVALWTGSPTWTCLGYFWGLTLSLQGIVTPELHGEFPSFAFLSFWAQHLPVVWVAAFVSIGLRQGPDWRLYRRCLTITLGWAAAVIVVNALIGANYGYLNHKPRAGSILDALGPWPWYVLVEILVVALLWALITWPWVRGGRRRPGAVR